MGDTKKLYLVLDMNTSYHQSKAGQHFGSSISFVKTEEDLQQYLSNVKRQGARPIVYDMDTPQARVVASRENSVCKEWLGRNGAMLERYDHGAVPELRRPGHPRQAHQVSVQKVL